MRTILLSLIVLALGMGCSEGLSEDESRTAMKATAGALTDGGQAGATSVGKADGVAMDFNHGCAGGGEMTLAGDMAGIQIGFDVGVKMTTCSRDGVTMTGELTYTMVSVNAILVTTSTYSYAGTVTYSGSIAGTCDVAMTGTVVGTPGVSIATWAGKFCDHDGDKVMVGVDISL